jgi:hypothetical protein
MTVALVAAVLALPAPGASAGPPQPFPVIHGTLPALSGAPGGTKLPGTFRGSPEVTAADLPGLQAELATVTARAQELADRLDQASAQDGGLRVAMERLAEQQEDAQARLDSRARLVYMRSRPNPFGALTEELAAPGLRRLAHQGQTAALTVDKALIDAVA